LERAAARHGESQFGIMPQTWVLPGELDRLKTYMKTCCDGGGSIASALNSPAVSANTGGGTQQCRIILKPVRHLANPHAYKQF
jgi:hypothetical protein